MSDELNEVVQPEVEQELPPETSDSSEEIVEESVDSSPEIAELQEKLNKEIEARRELTARARKAEAEKRILDARLKASQGSNPSLDVEDYIDISASLEGLDQREKERLAKEHKLSGRPLNEIRKDKDFLLWQRAYREEVEKERTLSPSNKQSESERPKSLTDKLRNASLEEKEKILQEAGLYKNVRPRSDRVIIGGQIIR